MTWSLANSCRLVNLMSIKDLRMLRSFYMAQQALSLELLEAKPLGMCKTTTSTNPHGQSLEEEDGQEVNVGSRGNEDSRVIL